MTRNTVNKIKRQMINEGEIFIINKGPKNQ